MLLEIKGDLNFLSSTLHKKFKARVSRINLIIKIFLTDSSNLLCSQYGRPQVCVVAHPWNLS